MELSVLIDVHLPLFLPNYQELMYILSNYQELMYLVLEKL